MQILDVYHCQFGTCIIQNILLKLYFSSIFSKPPTQPSIGILSLARTCSFLRYPMYFPSKHSLLFPFHNLSLYQIKNALRNSLNLLHAMMSSVDVRSILIPDAMRVSWTLEVRGQISFLYSI